MHEREQFQKQTYSEARGGSVDTVVTVPKLTYTGIVLWTLGAHRNMGYSWGNSYQLEFLGDQKGRNCHLYLIG